MAISYGSITIVDITDIGDFSVYPTANSPRTQIYNPDSSTHYIPDWSGQNPDTSLIITPVAYYASQNVSTQVTYSWKRRDGAGSLTNLGVNETVINFPDTNIPGPLRVNNNVLGNSSSGIISYVVTATYSIDGVNLEAVGEIDFSLTRQGTAAKTAKITGENIFKYDTTGTLTPSGKTITLTGIVAGVSITGWQYKNGNSWSIYPNSGTTSSLVVSPSDNVFSNDTATIKLVTDDNSVYDLFTITKLYDGAKGDSVLSAVLTNEDQMLPADKNGKITSYAGAETELTIIRGNTDITSNWYITKTYSPTTLNTLDAAVNNNEVDFTSVATTSTVLNNYDTAYVLFECRETQSGPIKFSRKFSLTKVKTGQDGTTPTIYSLEPTSVVVNANPKVNNVYSGHNPSTVTFNAYSQTGNTKSAYTGRIQFYIDDSSTISEAITTDVATRTINFNNSPWNAANRVKAVLYQAGADTNQLDAQTVVIVSNGEQGEDGQPGGNGFGAVNVVISNEADVIPCNSSNHPLSQFIIDIPYQGYQGTTVKTTSVSAPALSSSDFGSTINPDTSTAGHVKYTIPTTATLAANGTIQLSFTVSAQDYDSNGEVVSQNVTVNKLYSWTRSSAAVNGNDAIILQLTTPSGTIFDNNVGTLTAQAILYKGANVQSSNVTYKWYQYIVGTGYSEITSTTSTDNVYKNVSGDILTIKAAAVDGYKSFKVEAIYNSKTYTQYVSLIDKEDPLQVSVHSTIGTQIKNSQGMGAIYARVTRSGVQIDEVPMNIQAGTAYPTSPAPTTGDMFVLLSTETSSSARKATLMKYNGTTWVAQYGQCKYEWSFRNNNNTPITSGVPFQYTAEAEKIKNQFLYIDSSLINSKITIDVKVTLV